MKISLSAIALIYGASFVSALSIRSVLHDNGDIARREPEAEAEILHAPLNERFDEGLLSYLEKRRGGGGSGGGGGRGGSSSGSSSSGSSSSGSSGSSGGSSGSGRSGSTGSASSSSNSRPAYGGGRYYGGGATSPYRSGVRSPAGLLPIAVAGALIFPGLWLYGAYEYNYNHPYGFRNRTSNKNESLPVTCLCAKYSACGCDDNNNSTYIDDIIGNGTAADENSTLVHIGYVNNTKTLIINGTLPNGTDTDNSTSSSTSSASSNATRRYVLENSGFWLLGAIVGAIIWVL